MLLDCQSISFSFDKTRVVDSVSLSVPQGAIVGLVGPNGAGKSTLFSILSGFIAAEQGRVAFAGDDITRLSTIRRARKGLIRTFQVPREFRTLSVRENLAAAQTNRSGESVFRVFVQWAKTRAAEAVIQEKAAELISLCGLGPVADIPAARLSGGQKKLLEIARAAILNPRMLLLDEPFNGVNPVMIGKLIEVIRSLNERGTTFLIVEHNLGALSRIAPIFHVLDRGRLIASGPPSDVLENDLVRLAYLGAKDSKRAA